MDTSWQAAATRLKHLATFLQRKWNKRVPDFGCSAIALEPFFMLFPVSPPPELIKFLCAVTPDESVHLGVLNLMTPADLCEYQTDCAPVEDNTRFGLMALGNWTGESDGDAWIYDLRTGIIHSLSVGSGYEESLEGTLAMCYLHFNTLGEWVHHLVAQAADRKWLNESDIPKAA